MDWMRPDQPGDRPQRRDVFPKVTDDMEWIFPARRRGLRRHPYTHPPALSLISCAPESTCTHLGAGHREDSRRPRTAQPAAGHRPQILSPSLRAALRLGNL
ncbi:hypothetical protein GFS60_03402 [Rhodococcus sp. WAY2]|nr:hypothetical protein GFS60_03402 [Rhodococcus sp. WAY2]